MQYTIIGLGNPGDKYENTRHNAGRLAADYFEGVYEGDRAVFIHSGEYMNNSGRAVKQHISNKDELKNLIVVYDDIDLPLGSVKISYGRGSGGHNGVGSIIDSVGTKNFIRVRIGVAKKNIFGQVRKPGGDKKVHEFLLSPMSRRDQQALFDVIKSDVTFALNSILTKGRDSATCIVNSK